MLDILALLLAFFLGWFLSSIAYGLMLRRPIAKAFKSIHEDVKRITDTLFPPQEDTEG